MSKILYPVLIIFLLLVGAFRNEQTDESSNILVKDFIFYSSLELDDNFDKYEDNNEAGDY